MQLNEPNSHKSNKINENKETNITNKNPPRIRGIFTI